MTEAGETPAESLDRARRVQAAIAGHAGRYPRYLVVYGVGTIVATLWSGFIGTSLTAAIGFVIAWPVFITAISLWVNRQRASLPGMGRRHALYLGTQMAIFFIVLNAGLTPGLEGQVSYWLPMGLLVSVPIFIGAAYEARLLRRARGEA